MQLCKEGGVCDVGKALEHGKEHCRAKDVEGLPLTKDHNCQCQKACTGHADFKVPGLHRGHNIGQTADGAQRTGKDDTGVAHLVNVDAHRVRSLRMLAAGTQTQAEAGLIQHDVADHQQDQPQRHEHAEFQPADAEQEGLVGIVQLGAAALAEVLGDDHGNGGSQQVQCRTANGLVRLQVDRGKGQQQAVDHARQRCHQNGDQHHKEGRQACRQHGQGKHTGHAADDHDALQCNVDDAGMFAEHTAQCHQHQHDTVQQGIFDQKQHITCPPFWSFLRQAQALRSHWSFRHSGTAGSGSCRGTAWRMRTGR